jgi:uncharacterized protein
MRKVMLILFGFGLPALLFIPVLLARAKPEQDRFLQGIPLSETTYTQVEFPNQAQEINLAGMLFLPEGDGPFPAVVVIHGSGTSSRANSWYLAFTHYLQQNGIAVLLPDKRGSEKSGGDWRTASFTDLATDTLAAVSYLRTTYPDQISKIGVLGASQGGQVAPIAAAQSEDITFMINVVGSAVPFYEALVYEENHNLRQMGFLPGISNGIASLSSLYIRKVAQKEFWDQIGNYDPLPYYAQLDIPVLVMYGELDTNTPSAKSTQRLNSLGKENLQVLNFTGSGHPLEDPPGSGDSYFRADALQAMRDFIWQAVGE